MTATVHRYATHLHWSGSTGVGYDAYERAHQVVAIGADEVTIPLGLSADPAFHGEPTRWNPEQLVAAAASSCQCLSFLAVAARARLDVVSYRDEARAVMPEDDRPVRLTRIDLSPVVTLRVPSDVGSRPSHKRLRHLTEVAHRECFIANSLRTEVIVSPTFTWTDTSVP